MNKNEKIEKIFEVLKKQSFKNQSFKKDLTMKSATKDSIELNTENLQDLFDKKLMFYTDVCSYSLLYQKEVDENDNFSFYLKIYVNLDIINSHYICIKGICGKENILVNGKKVRNMIFKDWRIIEEKIS